MSSPKGAQPPAVASASAGNSTWREPSSATQALLKASCASILSKTDRRVWSPSFHWMMSALWFWVRAAVGQTQVLGWDHSLLHVICKDYFIDSQKELLTALKSVLLSSTLLHLTTPLHKSASATVLGTIPVGSVLLLLEDTPHRNYLVGETPLLQSILIESVWEPEDVSQWLNHCLPYMKLFLFHKIVTTTAIKLYVCMYIYILYGCGDMLVIPTLGGLGK